MVLPADDFLGTIADFLGECEVFWIEEEVVGCLEDVTVEGSGTGEVTGTDALSGREA